MQKRCLYIPFADLNDFAEKLRNQLDIVMNKLDKSEQKMELWSTHAMLSERGKIEVARMQHQWELEKQREISQENVLTQIRERRLP